MNTGTGKPIAAGLRSYAPVRQDATHLVHAEGLIAVTVSGAVRKRTVAGPSAYLCADTVVIGAA